MTYGHVLNNPQHFFKTGGYECGYNTNLTI